MQTIRVLLADDHALFRSGLTALLHNAGDIEIVGEAKDGHEALAKAEELVPDVILMDLYMPGLHGVEATGAIKKKLPQVKIIILTISEEDADLFDAIKVGAHGYLVKKIEPEVLIETLRRVSNGEVFLSGRTAGKILREFSRLANRDPEILGEPLSSREKDVLEKITKGATNKEIAAALFISENTVKNHLKNILGKLHLENRVQAATFALKKGLVGRHSE